LHTVICLSNELIRTAWKRCSLPDGPKVETDLRLALQPRVFLQLLTDGGHNLAVIFVFVFRTDVFLRDAGNGALVLFAYHDNHIVWT
jgi:hypothetical protein